MALLTLGGVLKQCGAAAELWDFDLYFKKVGNATEADFRKLIRLGVNGVGTHVFGISSICSNFPMALWIAKEIKAHRRDALIILGGPQPSSIPLQILERFEFIDAVVVGEGEETLREIVKENFELERLVKIPGIATRVDGKAVLGAKRPLTARMDDFPMPDYSLVDLEAYGQGKAFTPDIEIGRGCPFHCTFCSTSLMWEKDFRVKSPARILEEMESLHQAYGFTAFNFIHDNFTTSRKFVAEFCELMEEKNARGFQWTVSSRTDCIDVPRLERMRAAGLRGLFFGIETGSTRMQATIKKNLDFDKFEPILQRGNALGINMTTAFILGFPEEESQDMDETIHRALHYKCLGTSRVFFSKLTALTGTSLYRDFVGRMEETNYCSSTSPQHYGLPFIQNLIQEHPDLFSSFYHVPHPHFSKDYLSKFSEFAHLLVNGHPEIALMVIDGLGITPTRLFLLWDQWAGEKGVLYYDYRIFQESTFRTLFKKFLDDAIFASTLQTGAFAPCEDGQDRSSQAAHQG